jgi:hydroxypyruvate isomerase
LAEERNHAEFMRRMRQAIDVADALDATMFTIVGHQSIAGFDQATSLANLERALAQAAPLLEEAGRVAILEPFNPVDHEGHFLNGSRDALTVCRSIDSPAVKLNWDLYHMQLTEGNLIASLRDGIDQVAYVQIADVPGRHQPGTGEINYTKVFAALDDIGYDGPIGLECWPDAGDADRAIADLVATVERKVDT